MLVKIEARIRIFPGTDFHFPSTSVPPGTFLGSDSAPSSVSFVSSFSSRVNKARLWREQYSLPVCLSVCLSVPSGDFQLFYPRDAVLARSMLWPAVTHRYCIYTDEWIELVIGTEATFGFSYRGIRVGLFEKQGFSSETLSRSLGLAIFRNGTSIVASVVSLVPLTTVASLSH